MTSEDHTEHGPYASAAPGYYAAGWPGPIPLIGKSPPPRGWTGADGAWPSGADVMAWCDAVEGLQNIALRLPPHVLGVDVDDYDGKHGGVTLRALEARFGPLPPTWSSTSRGDGVSGIYLFAVPANLSWPGELPGGAVELIQTRHRYAVCWPSIHPETGQTYRWRYDRQVIDAIPDADDLPNLPQAWVDGLSTGPAVDVVRLDLADSDAQIWLDAFGQGVPCAAMTRRVIRACTDLVAGGSHHEAAKSATARIAYLITEGHTGGLQALDEVRAVYLATTGEPTRPGDWMRLLTGAVRIAATAGVDPLDPCGMWQRPGQSVPAVQLPAAYRNPTPMPLRQLTRIPPSNPMPAAQRIADYETGSLSAHAEPETPAAAPDPLEAVRAQMFAQEMLTQRVRREARAALDAEDHVRQFRVPPGLTSLTGELELPDVPVQYRVATLLPLGGNVLLTAPAKGGKTSLINNLARSLADGRPFLGRFDVAPLGEGRRVALWNYEVGREQYRAWLRQQNIVNTDAVTVLNLRGYRIPITVPFVEDWVVTWLIDHHVAVWIVDPFARAFGGDNENDNSEVSKYLDALDVIKERAKVTELILPTHTGRGRFDEGTEHARGATRLDDWADARWFLNTNEDGQRFFSASGRDVQFDESLLAFDENDRSMTLTGGGNRSKTRAVKLHDAIRATVSATPGISGNRLRSAVRSMTKGARNTDIDEAVDDLEAQGDLRIERGGVGKPNTHYPSTAGAFGPVIP